MKFLLTLGISSLGVAVVPVIHAVTGNLDALFVLLGLAALASFAAAAALPSDRRSPVPALVEGR
jgi:hypothetical protein